MREITLVTVCALELPTAQRNVILPKVLAVTERVKAFNGNNTTCPLCLVGVAKSIVEVRDGNLALIQSWLEGTWKSAKAINKVDLSHDQGWWRSRGFSCSLSTNVTVALGMAVPEGSE